MLLFFAIFAFVVAGLLWRVRIVVKCASVGTAILVWARLRFFYGVIPLTIVKQFNLKETAPLLARAEAKLFFDGIFKKKNKAKTKLWSAFHFKKAEVAICLGIGGDACGTALTAGFIQTVFECLKAIADCRFSGTAEADYEKSVCRIKLEGILDFYPSQIINAAVKRQLSKIRGKIYAASYRKHNAKLHGSAEKHR